MRDAGPGLPAEGVALAAVVVGSGVVCQNDGSCEGPVNGLDLCVRKAVGKKPGMELFHGGESYYTQ